MGTKCLSVLLATLMATTGVLMVAYGANALEEIDEGAVFEFTEDYDEDGKINTLVIGLPIDNISRTSYPSYLEYLDIEAQLWNEAGSSYIGFTVEEYDIDYFDPPGNITVFLEFSGRQINASGIDGPYLVDIVVTRIVTHPMIPSMPLSEDVIAEMEYITEAYMHTDFETPDPYEIASIGWQALDDDGDGLVDWISANITIDPVDDEIVTVYSDIGPEIGDELFSHSEEIEVESGESLPIRMDFDGRLLNGYGLEDSRYAIYVSITTPDGFSDFGWAMTDFFNASDFEEYTLNLAGHAASSLNDVDNDGLYDFLNVEFNVTSDDTAKYAIEACLLNPEGDTTAQASFDGYLVSGLEQTIVLFIELQDLYENIEAGPFEIEVRESPGAYGKWSEYDIMAEVVLGGFPAVGIDIDSLNHAEDLTLSGTLQDQEGAPVPWVDIIAIVINSTWSWMGVDMEVSAADGSFSLTGLVPGHATIHTSIPGYFNKTVYLHDFTSSITGLTITLEEDAPRNSTLQGTVFNSEGEPATEDCVIYVFRENSGLVYYVPVHEDGGYSVNLKEGGYILMAFFAAGTEGIYEMCIAQAAVEQDAVTELDLSLDVAVNITSLESMTGTIHKSLVFDDWSKVDIRCELTFAQLSDYLAFSMKVNADLLYGDADGYVEPEETVSASETMRLMSYMAMTGSYDYVAVDHYTLESFCVDGTGYLADLDDVAFSMPDITGSLFDDVGEASYVTEISGAEAYWPLDDSDAHRIYLEVPYNGSAEPLISSNVVFDIVVPEGYVLSWTNEPENIAIEGLTTVSVVPSDSPDPEVVESALVIMEFTAVTDDSLGAVHGFATLQGETDHAGILVELLDDDMSVLDSTITASTGEFALADVEPGDYWLHAGADGFLDLYETVSVTAGNVTDVDLELLPAGTPVEPGTVRGTVLTEAGLAIADAAVEAFAPVENSTAAETAVTDDLGEFNLTPLAPGEYRIEISAEGFDSETIYLVLREAETRNLGDVVLTSDSPVGYIFGSVEDEDGDPIEGVTVEVRAYGSDTLLGSDETDAEGRFMVVGLADGDYNLTVLLNGSVVVRMGVEVVDLVGDAGVIIVDLSAEEQADGYVVMLWPWVVLGALAVVVTVIVLMKLRRPGRPETSPPEGPSEPPSEPT